MTDQIPQGVQTHIPNVARMYDYYLGGKDNFPADRQAAEKVLEIIPEIRHSARANRAFLGRTVGLLAESGIDQFLDIGAGLPTRNNVHQVAPKRGSSTSTTTRPSWSTAGRSSARTRT